jgi:4-diphosphocytidyl-2-C-methyl-D-erythritol kinase
MIYKAYAKVNIFLKIVGTRGDYHELVSRFIRVENLYDELKFSDKKEDCEFELVGDFGCDLKSNTIFKAYKALCNAGYEDILKEFFGSKSLHVEKNIPSFAGLGGGSSDVATFLNMINANANLKLSVEELAKIGSSVGADVPFFVYGFKSANVSGIGEVVEEFEEEPLHVEIVTPKIMCDTAEVYKAFRQNFMIEPELAKKMANMSSLQLLDNYQSTTLNDLFRIALKLYPKLSEYKKEGWFFSGSGSSFFRNSGVMR